MTPASLPVLVILPAYNEAEVITEVIADIKRVLDCPVLVVDDGSTDETYQRVKAANIPVLRHPINRGAGAACMTGIAFARLKNYSCIAFMDADGQHIAEDLVPLFHRLQETQADLVIGSRFLSKNKQIPVIRRFYNQIANTLTNTFCQGRYSDTQSGFRLLGENAIAKINLHQDDFSYCSEMIIHAEQEGLKIEECPISVRYTPYSMRKGQDFQVGIKTAFNFLWRLLFR